MVSRLSIRLFPRGEPNTQKGPGITISLLCGLGVLLLACGDSNLGGHLLSVMSVSEDILVKKSLQGDLEAFSALVQAHQGAIRAYLVVRLGDKHEADDLAQDVFVTAHERLDTLKEGQPFGAWLRRIALNHYRNHRRKFRAMPVGGNADLQTLVDQTVEQHAGRLEEPETLGALRDCLAKLDGPARSLLHERYVLGHTVREISKAMGRGYSALTMQLHRLRQILADCIHAKVPSTH